MTTFAVEGILKTINTMEMPCNPTKLAELLEELNANDLAYVISYADPIHLRAFAQYLAEERFEDFPLCLTELKLEIRNDLLVVLFEEGKHKLLREILPEIESDDLSRLLSELPDTIREDLAQLLNAEDLREALDQLNYEVDTAGRIMSTDFISISKDMDIVEAFRNIKKVHSNAETVYYIYVVDNEERLIGVISLRDLLTQPNEKLVGEIMVTNITAVHLNDDQEHVARLVEHYNFNALPVVDDNDKLMGIVTVDDVIDVIRKEATEDIMKLAGTTPVEYGIMSPFRSFKSRVPWLMVSFFGGIVTVQVMGLLTGIVDRIMLLSFVPVIVGMGGNVANQSSTIIVRGLAIGIIRKDELFSVLIREILTAIILGCFFGLLLFISASFSFQDSYLYSLMVSSGIILSMLIASFVGSILPIVFHSISIDPAVATGPFVTTSIDILGILGYILAILVFRLFGGL